MHNRSTVAIGWIWPAGQIMIRFPICYYALPDVGAGFQSVVAEDPSATEQIIQSKYPGAITASLSDKVTDEQEIRRLFVDRPSKI